LQIWLVFHLQHLQYTTLIRLAVLRLVLLFRFLTARSLRPSACIAAYSVEDVLVLMNAFNPLPSGTVPCNSCGRN